MIKLSLLDKNIVMKNKKNIEKGSKIGECIFIKELESQIFPKTEISKRIRTRRIGLFYCNCGNKFKADISLVKKGNTKSCGCLFKQTSKEPKKITHGQTYHPLYNIWVGMIRRCGLESSNSYKYYGKRGITVVKEWYDINNFIKDMYSNYKKGLQLDRIDVNGNYEPSNCRWVTPKIQANNKRNNRIIEYNGINKNLNEWAYDLNIPINTLIYRLNNWSVEKSFTYKNKKE
jgi:hypothetical protein